MTKKISFPVGEEKMVDDMDLEYLPEGEYEIIHEYAAIKVKGAYVLRTVGYKLKRKS